jgi:hypothetical protein
MKTIFFLCLLVPQFLLAQSAEKKELIDRSLRVYYPEDFPAEYAESEEEVIEDWNHLFDRQNLERDDFKKRSEWRRVFPITRRKVHKIRGKRKFHHLVKKSYRYEIIEDPQSQNLVVEVRLHVWPSQTYLKRMERFHGQNHPDKKYYPLLDQMYANFDQQLTKAQFIWNRQAPAGVSFRFVRMKAAPKAHYSVKLVPSFRALYDQVLPANPDQETLAHEIGHMMGLDDENDLISTFASFHQILDMTIHRKKERDFYYSAYQDSKCNLESLMCLKTTIYPYHFDHILGRMPQN